MSGTILTTENEITTTLDSITLTTLDSTTEKELTINEADFEIYDTTTLEDQSNNSEMAPSSTNAESVDHTSAGITEETTTQAMNEIVENITLLPKDVEESSDGFDEFIENTTKTVDHDVEVTTESEQEFTTMMTTPKWQDGNEFQAEATTIVTEIDTITPDLVKIVPNNVEIDELVRSKSDLQSSRR